MNTECKTIDETPPSLYALKMISGGPNRIRLLLEIRAVRPDLNLIAAKAFLNDLPLVIKCGLPRDDVERLKRHFDGIAKMEIVLSDGRPLPQRLYETHSKTSRPRIIDG